MAYTKINTPQLWGVSRQGFEAGTWGNLMPTFRVPEKILKRFGLGAVTPDLDAIFNEVAQLYIDAVVSIYPVLNNIKIKALQPKDKDNLIKSVYLAMSFAIENGELIQIIKAKSLSTPSFTANQDVSPAIWAKDTLGVQSWNALLSAEIDYYDIMTVEDENVGMVITWLNAQGNIDYRGYQDNIGDWITSPDKEL